MPGNTVAAPAAILLGLAANNRSDSAISITFWRPCRSRYRNQCGPVGESSYRRVGSLMLWRCFRN